MKGYKRLTEREIKDLEWHSVQECYPRQDIPLYIKSSDRIRKGFFYWNGKTPVFASFGSDVESVVAWAYMQAEVE